MGKDVKPAVEIQFGFIEPHRDLYGTRVEFEGVMAFVDVEETKFLTRLVENSAEFSRQLPWTENATESYGKGTFEKDYLGPQASLAFKVWTIEGSLVVVS